MSHDAALLLLFIALGAVVSPSLGRWMGVPAAVVEIVYGLALGFTGLAAGESAPFVRFLADLGFALFLFLAGMEVDAAAIRRGGASRLVGPVASALASFLLASWVCARLGWSLWMGLALGATSVPLLLAVVREQGLGTSVIGRRMVTLAAVGEVITVALVAFGEVVDASGDWLHGVFGVLKLTTLLGVVLLGTRLIGVLRWWFPERAAALLGEGDVAELGVRAGFGLVFAMVAAAAFAGVEPLLGAFVGGLMVAFSVDDKHAFEQKFGAMAYGFFVPVFFVSVGMRLDPGELAQPSRLPQVLLACIVMFAVKLLPSLLGVFFGRPLWQMLSSALLLAAPLTLVIAIGDLALRLGKIDAASQGVLVVSAMIASLIYPTLARRLLARA